MYQHNKIKLCPFSQTPIYGELKTVPCFVSKTKQRATKIKTGKHKNEEERNRGGGGGREERAFADVVKQCFL